MSPQRVWAGSLGILLVAGVALAQEWEGTVVSYDKETMKLTVKEGDKERAVQLTKRTHVHYPEQGRIKEIRLNERPNYLKKGVRVRVEEEEGKVVEVNIILKK